jgi:predicted kinase
MGTGMKEMGNSMKHAYLMVGVSGSGKSTQLLKMVIEKHYHDVIRIFSLDECRHSFAEEQLGYPVDYARAYALAVEKPKEFDAHVNLRWRDALGATTLFIDNTNLSKKSRARWCADARQKGFFITGVQMLVALQTVLDRQDTRTDKSVPLSVVRDMYFRQQEVLVGSEVDAVLNVNGN